MNNAPIEEVVTGGVIIVASCVVGEIIAKRRTRELLSEEVNFVEEENLRVWGISSKKGGCVSGTYYRSSDKPSRVTYRVKESESLMHSVLQEDQRYSIGGEETHEDITHHTLILVQHLIVLTQPHQKHERGHVLETMYPLLALASLTSDIHQLVRQLPDFERRLGDARRFDSGAEDILVGRDISRRSQAIDSVKVVCGTVVELELS